MLITMLSKWPNAHGQVQCVWWFYHVFIRILSVLELLFANKTAVKIYDLHYGYTTKHYC